MPVTYVGKRVRCRTATGGTFETVARSEPFLNRRFVDKRTQPWMVVAIDHSGFDHPVNWPLEDVELITQGVQRCP